MTTPLTRVNVEAACRDLLEADVIAINCLSRAPRSAVYRATLADQGHSVVVKLYEGLAARKAARERRAITAVASGGLVRTPAILGYGLLPGVEAAALIMQDLGTTTLSRAVWAGASSRPEALFLLGRLLAGVHQLSPAPDRPGTGAMFPIHAADLQRHCPAWLRDAAAPALKRAAVLTAADVREVRCHGDLHPDNVILRAGIPYVVDFEQATCAVAEYDLAQTAVTSDALETDQLTQILAGYGWGVSQELLAALIVFHVVRGWVWAAVRENRDKALWSSRVHFVIDQYAGTF
jgi:aminoglycoside phosphotransferase (APT) family kinase protein